MSSALTGFAVFLLLNLGAGLWRIWRGPTAADRMSAVLLFGTTTVALLLVLAEIEQQPALRDVALLFVLLAAISSVAFVSLPLVRGTGRAEDE
jgi:multicomponent Na+:H+ antiporter subunit F